MCAIHAGRSLDSTMGFTAVDGLPMGTRTGQLDPGVVLYLLQPKGTTPREVERFLYHEAGLKGLSGISNDVRDLLASDDAAARPGARLFRLSHCPRGGRARGRMGGIDGIVFTAGIGERSPEIRARVIVAAGAGSASTRPRRQRAHGPLISTAASRSRPMSSRPTRSG